MSGNSDIFQRRKRALEVSQEHLLAKENQPVEPGNGIYDRWENPVITRDHTPLFWRYDYLAERNPRFMQRIGINSTFNAGAIKWDGSYVLAVRVEGDDRKSFFALADSPNGKDNFVFRDRPLIIPQTSDPDTNIYDMRLVAHEDGWVYGLFCTERKDTDPGADLSMAVAQCGIIRSQDLLQWERLPDLVTKSGQQRNVVLHPEYIDGQYAFYTRPQDGFISVGSGGGIGWGLSDSIDGASIDAETVVDGKIYHTIKEVKNGQGPAPLKTAEGWLHLAHGVRNTAAGLRYVLYLFVTELERPWVVKYAPGGHLIAPTGGERVGDVSNVVFSNGWILDDDGAVFIYYASSDTRLHVATSSIDRLLDYAKNTPPDGFTSAECVRQRIAMIDANLELLNR